MKKTINILVLLAILIIPALALAQSMPENRPLQPVPEGTRFDYENPLNGSDERYRNDASDDEEGPRENITDEQNPPAPATDEAGNVVSPEPSQDNGSRFSFAFVGGILVLVLIVAYVFFRKSKS